VPVIGSQVPRRGNRVTRWLGNALLVAFGWRVDGTFPDVPKVVGIVAPHTSNWDFFFGICTSFALGVHVSWVGKHTLFRWPYGGFMRWLGGTPVDRAAAEGLVGQIVKIMDGRDRFVLGLAPEGTRGRTRRWRSGFYHVAVGAGVPILLTHLDYPQKVVGIGPTFEPTGNVDEDLASILGSYHRRWAKYPAQF
jgi:1-acyl-sn-glycerol-3-phosphate acyltransferase